MFIRGDEMPLISIIVPVYNVEKYLYRCISSIRNQIINDIEIIMINDGSTDSSGVLCDELKKQDNRIIVIHQKNKGLAGARNTGLLYASGKYIGFIDSDDWITQDYYENLYTFIKKYDADIVSCSFSRAKEQITKSYSKTQRFKVMNRKESIEWFLSSAIAGGINDVSCCTKLYKREMLHDLKFQEGIIYEDMVFNWFAINRCNCYIKTFEKKYFYFVNDNSITRNSFSNKSYDLIKGAEIIKKSYNGKDKQIIKLISEYSAKTHFSVFIKMLRSKNIDFENMNKELKKVKQDYHLLMHSPLSLSRKIILFIVVLLPEKIWSYIKN